MTTPDREAAPPARPASERDLVPVLSDVERLALREGAIALMEKWSRYPGSDKERKLAGVLHALAGRLK